MRREMEDEAGLEEQRRRCEECRLGMKKGEDSHRESSS